MNYTEHKISTEQVGAFLLALMDHVPNAEAGRAVLTAAREVFNLTLPLCGAVYRAGELAYPPVCALPFGHDDEYHDSAPGYEGGSAWRVTEART